MTDTIGQHNIWYILITIMIVVFVGRVVARKMYPRVEGFAGMERYQVKENDELFDNFYVSFYDQLMYSRDKIRYEFDKISAHMIKVTRDAELDIDDDFEKSFVEKISTSVSNRRISDPVRFVYDKRISIDTLNFLKQKIGCY